MQHQKQIFRAVGRGMQHVGIDEPALPAVQHLFRVGRAVQNGTAAYIKQLCTLVPMPWCTVHAKVCTVHQTADMRELRGITGQMLLPAVGIAVFYIRNMKHACHLLLHPF